MTRWDVFLCHSKRDRELVVDLDRRLRGDGFSVWFDEREILPGERWEVSIEEGIRKSQVFLICFSNNWIADRSYAHKELKLAFEIMQELPEDRVFIIPARLDDCEIPRSIRWLQWVNLYDADGYVKLQMSLKRNLKSATPVAPAAGISSVKALAQALGWTIIEFDPWQGRNVEEQNMLEHFESGDTLTRSHDALEANDFRRVVEIWAPIEKNQYFNVLHPFWAHNAFIRCAVFRARTDLCTSHVHIGNDDIESVESHFSSALNLLGELVRMEPFSMKHETDSDLPADLARVQNDDYVALCRFALNWSRAWGGLITDFTGTPWTEVQSVMGTVESRLRQLQNLLSAGEET